MMSYIGLFSVCAHRPSAATARYTIIHPVVMLVLLVIFTIRVRAHVPTSRG